MKNINIAHIDTPMTWRGGERQLIELMRGLKERNQKNVLFCKTSSKLSRRAKEIGIEVFHLPMFGEWDIFSALKLRSYIIREGVNILHAHSAHAHSIGLIALMGVSSCKFVVSRRVDFHIANIFSRKIKYGSSVDRIIAVSNAVRRILVEDGVDPNRVVTIRSGFVRKEFEEENVSNISNINLREQLGLSDDTIVIVNVAALAPHKAHNVLLKAANIVVKKHPEVKFLLAGDGELKSSIEKNIRNLGLEKSVTLLGFVDSIGIVFEAADIFAVSSREEGLCSSILDAMYFSLPIVATNAGGIPELVQDGVNGLIVPVDDHDLFAEKLISLIENPEKREIMGSRSRDLLGQNTIEKTVEETLHVYKKLWE